jgi:hypothetical protein
VRYSVGASLIISALISASSFFIVAASRFMLRVSPAALLVSDANLVMLRHGVDVVSVLGAFVAVRVMDRWIFVDETEITGESGIVSYDP